MQELSEAVISSWFDRFNEAFATFDASRVAELFAVPGVALRGDGSLVALTIREDVVRYYRTALDGYRKSGCVGCRWDALEIERMGSQSAVATVTWNLFKIDGSDLAIWRQSYCLTRTADGLKVFASASHANSS